MLRLNQKAMNLNHMLSIEKEIEQVLHLRDEENLTFHDIGEKLGFSKSTAQRRYAAGLVDIALDGVIIEDKILPKINKLNFEVKDYLPEAPNTPERFKPMVVIGDAIITADWHIPLHDPLAINRMLHYAKHSGIKQLIIAGDYLHADSFGSYMPYQPEASWEVEELEANRVMKTLLRYFDHIFISYGNHDYRVSRSTGYKYSFTDCMKHILSSLSEEEKARVHYSDLDYLYYYPTGAQGRIIRICHPSKNFSTIPLTVPRKLAVKYSCSVISGHSHHCAIGFAPNGYDMAIEVGGFFAKERTEYIQESTANHVWTQGYVEFQDGIPTLHSPLFGNM